MNCDCGYCVRNWGSQCEYTPAPTSFKSHNFMWFHFGKYAKLYEKEDEMETVVPPTPTPTPATVQCKYCKCNGPEGKYCFFCGKSFIF